MVNKLLCRLFGHHWMHAHRIESGWQGDNVWVYIGHVCPCCYAIEYKLPDPTQRTPGWLKLS